MPDVLYRYLSTPTNTEDKQHLLLLEEQIRLVKRQNKLIIFMLSLSTALIVILLITAWACYFFLRYIMANPI